MAENLTFLEAFEWNIPADQKHWQRLHRNLPALKAIGINNLWLPPACKGGNFKGNGYDVYDLYDLGEFHQKGSRSTKWGSKEDLLALAEGARQLEIGLHFDAVLNHRCGGDATERVKVAMVDDKGSLFSAMSPVIHLADGSSRLTTLASPKIVGEISPNHLMRKPG
jgi:alpha-amylase